MTGGTSDETTAAAEIVLPFAVYTPADAAGNAAQSEACQAGFLSPQPLAETILFVSSQNLLILLVAFP